MKKTKEIFKNTMVYFFHWCFLYIYDYWLLREKKLAVPKTMLLIKVDAIGDYVIFRNFIECIKNSKKYKDYSITLCGNIIWKDVAEKFDANFVDEFIWIDKNNFVSNKKYRKNILNLIRNRGFEIAVQPTYSREFLYGDAIMRASGSRKRIGNSGDSTNINRLSKFIFNQFYTDLLIADNDTLFEFYRNKEFFEEFLGEKILLDKPDFNLPKNTVSKKYAVIMPGTSLLINRWDSAKYAEIVMYLHKKYDMRIFIAGGDQDIITAQEIVARTYAIPIEIVAGKKLDEFIKLVSNASILISNETSAVHIGVATNTPTVCISRGSRFGRFDPYPKKIFNNIAYAYPPEIKNCSNDFDYLCKAYKNKSNLDINKITVTEVIDIINGIL